LGLFGKCRGVRVSACSVCVRVVMPGAAAAGGMDADAAAKAYSGVCSKCHGPTGRGMASFPRLSDKDKEYLAGRLRQYRAGEMVGPNTPLMMPHAVNLSDAEIDGLAAYIAAAFAEN